MEENKELNIMEFKKAEPELNVMDIPAVETKKPKVAKKRYSKKNLKKIVLEAGFSVIIASGAVSVVQYIDKCREGTNAIIDKIEKSGVLPNGLCSTPSARGYILQYRDANNNVQFATDDSAVDLVNEILETALSNDISASEIEIYFEKGLGYDVNFEGVDMFSKQDAKIKAQERAQFEELSNKYGTEGRAR